MKQTTTKFLFVTVLDREKLETFLNKNAEEGWHPIKMNFFRIQFAYQPENKNRYSVMVRNQAQGYTSYNKEDERQTDILESFDYEHIFKTTVFNVYQSRAKEPIMSDPLLEAQQVRKSENREMLGQGLLVLAATLNIKVQMTHPYFLIKSNISILSVIMWCVLLFIVLRRIYRILRARKGHPFADKHRWRSRRTDPMTLIAIVAWLGLVLYPLTKIPTIGPLLMMIPLFAILYILQYLIQGLKVSKVIKYLLFIVLLYLGITQVLRISLNTNTPLNQTTTFISESVLMKETDGFVSGHAVTMLEIKTPALSNWIQKLFYENNAITIPIENNRKIKFTTQYGRTYYIFQTENRIILSDQQLMDAFYENPVFDETNSTYDFH